MTCSCKNCALSYRMIKFDYTKGGCEHTDMEGHICMAFATEERVAIWMVGSDNGMCECYTPKAEEVE